MIRMLLHSKDLVPTEWPPSLPSNGYWEIFEDDSMETARFVLHVSIPFSLREKKAWKDIVEAGDVGVDAFQCHIRNRLISQLEKYTNELKEDPEEALQRGLEEWETSQERLRPKEFGADGKEESRD